MSDCPPECRILCCAQPWRVYILGCALLTVYGFAVCPFIEGGLAWWQFAGPMLACLGAGLALRRVVLRDPVLSPDLEPADLLSLPPRIFGFDLGVWAIAGVLLTGWNMAAHGFPPESGGKVLVGCLTLGLFSAGHLAIRAEEAIVEVLAARGTLLVIDVDAFRWSTSRFFRFLAVAMAMSLVVLLLLIRKDFLYVIEALGAGQPVSFLGIVVETCFVVAVLFGGTWLVLRRHEGLLRRLFDLELVALGAVGRGRLDVRVPVLRADEFGAMAAQTNRMIEGLVEKERIEDAFGKYMSPEVAKAILGAEGGPRLGGRAVQVAVLFSDIRNFTPLSEALPPDELVQVLNELFTEVVEAIHRHGGVVDKFIGDCVMAVFGLAEGRDDCQDAVQAALAMREALAAFNPRLTARGLPEVDMGIGIHHGPVIAGNIGSPERLEYTVIGDTVNVAARLESMTKELGTWLALSAEVAAAIGAELVPGLECLGHHPLKGKSGEHEVFGLRAPEPA